MKNNSLKTLQELIRKNPSLSFLNGILAIGITVSLLLNFFDQENITIGLKTTICIFLWSPGFYLIWQGISGKLTGKEQKGFRVIQWGQLTLVVVLSLAFVINDFLKPIENKKIKSKSFKEPISKKDTVSKPRKPEFFIPHQFSKIKGQLLEASHESFRFSNSGKKVEFKFDPNKLTQGKDKSKTRFLGSNIKIYVNDQFCYELTRFKLSKSHSLGGDSLDVIDGINQEILQKLNSVQILADEEINSIIECLRESY